MTSWRLGAQGGAGSVRATRSAILGWALFTLGAASCRSQPPEPTPGATASAAGSTAPTATTDYAHPVDPAAKKKIAQPDCDAWGKHGAEAFLATVRVASDQCPPAARDEVRAQFQDRIVTIAGGATSICANHLGEVYSAGDAACYMRAKDALTLQACNFAPMTNKEDTDWGVVFKSIHDRCSILPPNAPGAPPPGGPVPQGSGPKPAPAPSAVPM